MKLLLPPQPRQEDTSYPVSYLREMLSIDMKSVVIDY